MKIISAMNPRRFGEDFTNILLTAWFEEFPNHSFEFLASLFDCEEHGRELWFRAMKGEYGDIEVLPEIIYAEPSSMKIINVEPIRMLKHDDTSIS